MLLLLFVVLVVVVLLFCWAWGEPLDEIFDESFAEEESTKEKNQFNLKKNQKMKGKTYFDLMVLLFRLSRMEDLLVVDVPMALFPSFAFHVYVVQYFFVLTALMFHHDSFYKDYLCLTQRIWALHFAPPYFPPLNSCCQ